LFVHSSIIVECNLGGKLGIKSPLVPLY
jgi:hypothetical protein